MLKEGKARANIKELCRKDWIAQATICNCQANHIGMTVSIGRQLEEFEVDNTTLNRLLAEAEFMKVALKDLQHPKWYARKRIAMRLRDKQAKSVYAIQQPTFIFTPLASLPSGAPSACRRGSRAFGAR